MSMKAFAGIGSRDITPIEGYRIMNLSRELTRKGYLLYSGHADGADGAFELGALPMKAIIWIPWFGYNGPTSQIAFEVGASWEGIQSVVDYHPNHKSLSKGVMALMARNWHQVMGRLDYPPVDFVVCCADPVGTWEVKGGTGQAIRIARDKGIPVFNMRRDNWKNELERFLNDGSR